MEFHIIDLWDFKIIAVCHYDLRVYQLVESTKSILVNWFLGLLTFPIFVQVNTQWLWSPRGFSSRAPCRLLSPLASYFPPMNRISGDSAPLLLQVNRSSTFLFAATMMSATREFMVPYVIMIECFGQRIIASSSKKWLAIFSFDSRKWGYMWNSCDFTLKMCLI